MADNQTVNLVSADGKRKWSTTDAVEVTNLRQRGWRDAAPAKTVETKTNK